jgi:hypothetical protein
MQIQSDRMVPLKVHKNEIFLLDFEICTISMLVMSKLQEFTTTKF